ncbi:hypothetical protein QBC35DRAFT_546447 [Podospora australis]|uniref:F-box domain-containing protein n=1 Tax=Podospora australis TaxID=1536484 RepID=A0AAN6WWH1_9PEZI|nr:hypothetical protein QBC35DRAFT_546447 [Podospora australis]
MPPQKIVVFSTGEVVVENPICDPGAGNLRKNQLPVETVFAHTVDELTYHAQYFRGSRDFRLESKVAQTSCQLLATRCRNFDKIREAVKWYPLVSSARAITGLDGLEVFPVELIYDILNLLDISSLMAFRQVNRQARRVASHRWDFQIAQRYALQPLLTAMYTGTARYFRLADLLETLSTQRCCTCARPWGYVFLLTLKRCCAECAWFSGLGRYVAFVIPEPTEKKLLSRHRRRAWAIHENLDQALALQSGTNQLPRQLPDQTRALWCAGCYRLGGTVHSRFGYRAFSVDEFPGHFQWCLPAQKLFDNEHQQIRKKTQRKTQRKTQA